jgi:hypothetical protein
MSHTRPAINHHGVGVSVGVSVAVGKGVSLGVGVGKGVLLGSDVSLAVGGGNGVKVVVGIGVTEAVGVGVAVSVTVGVAVSVSVGVGVAVGCCTMKRTRASALRPDLLKTMMRSVTGPSGSGFKSQSARRPVSGNGLVFGPATEPQPPGSWLSPYSMMK